jgi:hypothetical protein
MTHSDEVDLNRHASEVAMHELAGVNAAVTALLDRDALPES